MRTAIPLTITTIALATLSAQTQSPLPTFEVATIKPAERGAIGLFTYPGGRIVASGLTLEMLLEQALDVQEYQVSGGPGWLRDTRYTIEARPPASSKSAASNPINIKLAPNDEQRQMLLALLMDRFHLKFHRESKEGAVYVLAKGTNELKLTQAKNRDDFPWAGGLAGGMISVGDGLAGVNISIPQFCARLSRYMLRPVIDKTGLTGSFDFRYEQRSDEPHNDVVSWIITSVQAIGLKLESSKGPVETIVIEHAEKPSDN